METKLLDPPVIIIGMHRSGTSLLSKLLENCGIFQGYVHDRFNEPLFFQLINEQLLRLVRATWDHPEKMGVITADSHLGKTLVEYVARIVDGQLLQNYWGYDNYNNLVKGESPFRGWGWKDPRNSLLLPVWLELFEGSKIIHIIRHGIDSAVSLWRRELYDRSSGRCQNLKECFKIWEEYVQKGKAYGACAKNYLEIKYEDLIEQEPETMKCLSDFLKTDVSFEAAGDEVEVRKDRRFAYLNDDQSKEFYGWALENELLNTLYPR